MDEDKLKESIKRREKAERRARILKIIELIEAGEIDSSKIPRQFLFNRSEKPRETYISPRERNTYNYGYMTLDEMMASSPYAR